MDLTDAQKEEYEEQLENTTVKSLLIQQNAYLDAILRQLEGVEEGESETAVCTKCNTTVNIDNRQEHLKQEHNAPDGVDVSVFFE
jgi:hypothetical protein